MNGLVLGKFYPFHVGHAFLIGFAQAHCDILHVVVGSLPSERIDGEVRAGWLREHFPNVVVHHLNQVLPQYPEEAEDFWDQWRRALTTILPVEVDSVYTTEAYGEGLAECLGAKWICPDIGRERLPVSATEIRRQPWNHWAMLPEVVQRDLRKTVVVFGPESTGKTVLTRRLAEHFQTLAAPEYARTFIEQHNSDFDLASMDDIVRGQHALVEALLPLSGAALFCDTDCRASVVWSEQLFGEVSGVVSEYGERADADLYLLCDVDVPWIDDPVRYLPDNREAFFDACVDALEGERVVMVSGDWESRWETARCAVASLLEI